MCYNKFLTNCSPIPPANIDGTLTNDSMFNRPIPDKPWPLSHNNNVNRDCISLHVKYLVQPDASLAPNSNKKPPMNAFDMLTPSTLP